MSEPTPDDFDDGFDNVGCPNCGGEGVIYMCLDEIGCVDPEGGCERARLGQNGGPPLECEEVAS